MPLASYPVLCYRPGCGQGALFKIAARWSDGVTQELKTYSLSCQECLGPLFQDAWARHAVCRRAPGEVLEVPGVYELVRGTRDQQLSRRLDLERILAEPLVSKLLQPSQVTDEVEDAPGTPADGRIQ